MVRVQLAKGHSTRITWSYLLGLDDVLVGAKTMVLVNILDLSQSQPCRAMKQQAEIRRCRPHGNSSLMGAWMHNKIEEHFICYYKS